MRLPLLLSIFLTVPSSMLASGPVADASLKSRPTTLAYQRISADGLSRLRIYNFNDERKGFVLYSGEDVVGYSPEGNFSEESAPPALMAMLESFSAPEVPEAAEETGKWDAVAPLENGRGYAMWNQDAPFNDLCPDYELGKRAPTGCVATAMAQVMFYHQWPLKGTGSHTYSPFVLHGNTLTGDFENTLYRWDAMIPNYGSGMAGADNEDSRAAVAELMLHCGIAVEMVYYTQSGATDYDVPPALVNYFGYDRGMAYRQREHYNSTEWLEIINRELREGRPVLAYGKSASGGHAFVFDGMDSDGFIHVNWGWGGMSNGYFNTSVLTPPMQGIGGADGGFNYSQRIITGIRPAGAVPGDYHVEITSTEGLTAGRKKIKQGEEVKIKFSGKVYNRGWRDAEFDYALLLVDSEGKTMKVMEGPAGHSLAVDANEYAPDFGNISFGVLDEGEYTLVPAVRATDAEGEWIPVRDEYIGYPNTLRVSATESEIAFESFDYFDLSTESLDVPEVIWANLPTLITTEIVNKGDSEYHGEIRAVLYNGNSIAASTSNYLIDLVPGESTSIRFTDAFNIAAGEYTLSLLNDDGQKISSPVTVTVKEVVKLGNVSSCAKVAVVESSPELVSVKGVLKADAMFQGLLYAFLFDANGNTELGCLYPEFISLDTANELEVVLKGEFENGIPGKEYQIQLAVYSQDNYTFLKDEDSTVNFILAGGAGVSGVTEKESSEYRYYDFNGLEVDPKETRLYKKVKISSW
ncbi:MAG: hypothetical protein HDS26_06905 [Bacteroides sp.]|nr:hypothetical protein [Bacteroides sp.]